MVWKPKVISCPDGGEVVAIGVRDTGLIFVIAAIAELGVPRKELRNCTLGGTSGFAKLKKARNSAQAAEMCKPTSTPAKGLFDKPQTDDQVTPAKVVKKRTRAELSDLRGNPNLFDVVLDNGVSIRMQRPVCSSDEMFVHLDPENIMKVMTFMAEDGLTIDDLHGSRKWGSSGHKGVWKYGRYYYDAANPGECVRRAPSDLKDHGDQEVEESLGAPALDDIDEASE